MWFFGKKRAEAIRKEAEKMLRDVVESATTKHELETAGAISSDIRDSFVDMNQKILESFNKIQEATETNSISIASVSKMLTQLLEAYYILEARVHALESDLSVSGVKFTKGNEN
jgi:predicted  nucleic acid-binding Zn-ribbon protein